MINIKGIKSFIYASFITTVTYIIKMNIETG